MTTVLTQNGSKPHTQNQGWLKQSVRQFFGAFNWEDHPPEVQELKLAPTPVGEQQTLSLKLTVRQFFDAINWEGATIAALPNSGLDSAPEMPDIASGNDTFTLDDFSEFF